jgi:Tfp pilus assembly protein PilZ
MRYSRQGNSIHTASGTCNKCCPSDIIILALTKGGVQIKTQKNASTGKEVHKNTSTYRIRENLVTSMTVDWWDRFAMAIRMIGVLTTSSNKCIKIRRNGEVLVFRICACMRMFYHLKSLTVLY